MKTQGVSDTFPTEHELMKLQTYMMLLKKTRPVSDSSSDILSGARLINDHSRERGREGEWETERERECVREREGGREREEGIEEVSSAR